MAKRANDLPSVSSTISVLAGSALVISVAVVVYFNQVSDAGLMASAYSGAAIAAITVMPYMISAAVAALVAVAIMRILPMAGLNRELEQLSLHLREMAAGDLNTRMKMRSMNPQVQQLANDINLCSEELCRRVVDMKIINRQQWDILEVIRHESVRTASAELINNIEQMQTNWEKLAEVESQIVT
ncbi:MAG TPA: hypothetical protein PLF13_08990 [candidate division Zixibacteria bacterium]|nr:hypothetical protein [candidate division Zixibacteria bacterium]